MSPPSGRIIATLSACLILLGPSSHSLAEWRDHPDLPDWARRGYVRWGHGGNVAGKLTWHPGGHGADADNVRVILHCGRNLQQSMGYMDEEAERIGEEGGLRRQPYICSKTIRWEREFPEYDGLEHATCRKLDGSRPLMYGNPQRYPGCYNNPIWREYMKRRVDTRFAAEGGPVHSIFFDNINFYDCRCEHCQESFKRFTGDTFGEEMDLTEPGEHPNFEFAKVLWQAECTHDFFEEIKAYIRTVQDPTPISPNFHVGGGWTTYLTWRGTSDIIFYEEGHTFPPFASTVIGYKVGLAASHGRAVGQLLGLPPHEARARALSLNPRHEAGIVEAFMYPEEHRLALAEAVACDGTYIASFSLREQKIAAGDAPRHVAVREALHQYSAFVSEHAHLYELAQPGASVAVLHSIWSRLAGRKTCWPTITDTCRALGDAGIPYEVIIEDDLTPELLAPYQLVVLPLANLMSREDARTLLEWVRGGGAIVVIGDVATKDRLCRDYAAEALPELAKLPVGGPTPLGEGRFWRLASEQKLGDIPGDDLPARLAEVAGPLGCHVTASSGRLFANMLTTRDGSTLSVHLVNSDFAYAPLESRDLRDDDGKPDARTYFAATSTRAKKLIEVPDPGARQGDCVRFYGQAYPGCTDAFSLVVSMNGQDLATLKGTQLRTDRWYQLPIPEGLLAESSEVVFRAIGSPNSHPDYFQLRIDTGATSRRSWWSSDEGKTWSNEDLSPDGGQQVGEYMVRIGPRIEEDAVAEPEDFIGGLTVNPARDVEVRVSLDGEAPAARLISPDAPEQTLAPTPADGFAVYRVPEVYIYSVLIIPTG